MTLRQQWTAYCHAMSTTYQLAVWYVDEELRHVRLVYDVVHGGMRLERWRPMCHKRAINYDVLRCFSLPPRCAPARARRCAERIIATWLRSTSGPSPSTR
jgi:hypothetical protein